jgi:hypothetical protein
MIGTKVYDVLVELVPGVNHPLNAFGTGTGPQGMLRYTTAVDIFGAQVPAPTGPLPLTRGYQFLVAGYVYPAGSLDVCVKNPTAACVPSQKPIGNWLCSGWALADANENPWPTGKALSYATIFFNISQAEDKEFPIMGNIAANTLEGSNFADIGRKFLVPVTGATGSFAGINSSMRTESLGFLGANGFGPGLGVGLRFKVTRSIFPRETEKKSEK